MYGGFLFLRFKAIIMRNLFLFSVLIFSLPLFSQQIEWNSSRILLEIQKLNTTGSVLYIAAHPDDENTRMITYLANERKVRTGYLSLTRGDGGQNLIGEEQGAYLGLIRTQELLAARKLDGGEQFFTRAVDFGYSKTAEETYSIWPHDSLLADVVWVIRNFRPEVIITRFPPDERAGHGQHTVSALLAEEAFDAAADPTKFPEQLKYVSVWQTQRIFWNTSLRWDDKLVEQIKNGDKNIVAMDVGGYNPLLGRSYGEIAADSRTNHKSQGFGSTPTRGEQIEYLYLKKGTQCKDILDGISTTWERYRQGSEIKLFLEKIIAEYNILKPANSVDDLLKVYDLLEKMPQDKLIEFKKQQLQNILVACLGLWLEPVAEKDMVANEDTLKVFNNMLLRAEYPVSVDSYSCFNETVILNKNLISEKNLNDTIQLIIPGRIASSPYWLDGDYDGLFNAQSQLMIGKPENDPAVSFTYTIKIGDKRFAIRRGMVYKETDAVKGEIYKPVEIIPMVTVNLDFTVIPFGLNENINISAKISANKNIDSIYLTAEDEWQWKVAPELRAVKLNKGESKYLHFNITPDENAKNNTFSIAYSTQNSGDRQQFIFAESVNIIDYEHIPRQTILEPARIEFVKVDTKIPSKKIAYIEGAGDKVDENLLQLGLNITTIKPEQISVDELKKYDVVIVGVRAYNVSKTLADNQNILMNYVKEGGLVITQYSTNWDIYRQDIGPYKFKIGRGRVTDENSPVEFLLPDHPVLNYPNKISQEDFKGWIQERGIYFAEELSPEYQAPLAFTDPNEKPQNGSVIIADYGEGAFIYTGIAFFRELPAGVAGAYRLIVNLIEYEK